MAYLCGDEAAAPYLAALSIIIFVLYFVLLSWFLSRRHLQPIQFRGPLMLAFVAIAVMLRVILVAIWSISPLTSSCYAQIMFHNGIYMGLAIGTVRLYILLFSYKVQNERIAFLENGGKKGFWLSHIHWVSVSRVYPIGLILVILPQIFENIFIKEVPCSVVENEKLNSTFIKDHNGSYLSFPSKHADYCVFSDRCPSGSIDSDLYMYVLIAYFIIVFILATNLRTFEKDRFYVNMEFRLTAVWMLCWVITDFVIQEVTPSLELYLNNPQGFNELFFLFVYALISLAYPLQKSYKLARTRNNTSSAFELGADNHSKEVIAEGNENDDDEEGNRIGELPHQIPKEDALNSSLQVAVTKSGSSTLGLASRLTVSMRGSTLKGISPTMINKKKLKKILRDKEGYTLFREHLKLEFSIENILSWTESQKLKVEIDEAILNPTIDHSIVSKIKGFVESFVNEGAINQVNVSSKERETCEVALEKLLTAVASGCGYEEYNARLKDMRKCIKDIDHEILELMAKDSFIRFMNTPEYKKYSENKRIGASTMNFKTGLDLVPRSSPLS